MNKPTIERNRKQTKTKTEQPVVTATEIAKDDDLNVAVEKVRTTVLMPTDVLKRLKMLAVQNDTTLTDLFVSAVREKYKL